MALSLDMRGTARPRRNAKPELPPLLRDYFEYVRGNPEICGQAPIEYLDRLWRQANEFAKRNGVVCPVCREEMQALRAAMEGCGTAKPTELPAPLDERQVTRQCAPGRSECQVVWTELDHLDAASKENPS